MLFGNQNLFLRLVHNHNSVDFISLKIQTPLISDFENQNWIDFSFFVQTDLEDVQALLP